MKIYPLSKHFTLLSNVEPQVKEAVFLVFNLQ